MTDTTALDTSLATANIAENEAALEGTATSNVDGLDIYPHSITCEHGYFSDGVFQGILQVGGIIVGEGAVVVTGDMSIADGGVTISNDGGVSGIFIGDNEIYSKVDDVKTVDWNGLLGTIEATKFLLKTAATGERLEIDSTDGMVVYDSDDAARTKVDVEGLTITAADATASTPEQQATFRADGSDTVGGIYLARSSYTLTKV
jgi:hypothetical protein